MAVRLALGLLVCSTLVMFVGCSGGGKSGNTGPSIASQLATAQAETDPEVRASLLSAVALEQHAAGQSYDAKQTLQQAAESARKIARPDLQAKMLARVAQDQAKINSKIEAKQTLKSTLAVIDTLESVDAKAAALAETAAAQAGIGEKRDAEDTLNRAVEMAETVEAPADRIPILTRIAAAQQAAELTDAAKSTLGEAMTQSLLVEDKQVRAERQAEIGKTLQPIDAGRAKEAFDMAVTTAESIENDTARAYGFIKVGTQMWTAGLQSMGQAQFDKANDLARTVGSPSDRQAILDQVERTINQLKG